MNSGAHIQVRLTGYNSHLPLQPPISPHSLSTTHGKHVRVPWASPVAQLVKYLPAMWETWVRSLGWEDPLVKGMATPLQYSGLENSMDRGAWQATDYGIFEESDITEQLSVSW